MTRLNVFVLSVFCCSTPVRAADERPSTDAKPANTEQVASPRAVATVVGPNPSYVGQLVEVEFDLLTDDRAPHELAPFFPELQVDGAIAILSRGAPPPELKTVDSTRFLVRKRKYLVFPQDAGAITIPPLRIALNADDGKSGSVVSKALTLHADIPPGDPRGRLPLVARNVRVERVIDGQFEHLQVGDTFTVTLRVQADNTDPVMLPAAEFPEIRGLSRYLGQGSTRASVDRGSYHAERVDTVTYVANEWGFYRLPQVSFFWLDPVTGTFAEATAPARSFRVRANPRLGFGCVGGPRVTATVGGGAASLLIVGLLGVRWIRRLARERASRSPVRRDADERMAFAALRAVAKTRKDGKTLTALYAWLRVGLQNVKTLKAFRLMAEDQNVTSSTEQLELRVSTGQGRGETEDILAPIAAFRRRHRGSSKREALHPLNRSGDPDSVRAPETGSR